MQSRAVYMFLLVLISVIVQIKSEVLLCPDPPPCGTSNDCCECSVIHFKHKISGLSINCKRRNLTKIPDFSSLEGFPLAQLDLSHNRITTIPKDKFKMVTFRALDRWKPAKLILSSNPLSSISDHAFQVARADKLALHLDNCSMKSIHHRALIRVDNLTELYLDNNEISNIPSKSLSNLNKLSTLSLHGNDIKRVDDDIFSGLEKTLKRIILSKTGLAEFPKKAFKGLKELITLDLSQNLITSLQNDLFQGYASTYSFTSLNLGNNKITEINENAFRGVDSMMHISSLVLDNNRLTTLNFLNKPCNSVFLNLQTSIYVLGNPLECDCRLFNAIRTGFFRVRGKCETPPRYKNMRIDVNMARYAGDVYYRGSFGYHASENECSHELKSSQNLTCLEARYAAIASSATSFTYAISWVVVIHAMHHWCQY